MLSDTYICSWCIEITYILPLTYTILSYIFCIYMASICGCVKVLPILLQRNSFAMLAIFYLLGHGHIAPSQIVGGWALGRRGGRRGGGGGLGNPVHSSAKLHWYEGKLIEKYPNRADFFYQFVAIFQQMLLNCLMVLRDRVSFMLQ